MTQAMEGGSFPQSVPTFRHMMSGIKIGYNSRMARGWESKAVEEQQAEARSKPDSVKVRLEPAQVAKEKERQGLLLSRQRVLQQLQAAQNSFHRKMLEAALGDLEAQLARLG